MMFTLVYTLFILHFFAFLKLFFLISAPPRNIEIYYTHPDSKTVNLTCSAKGVYPKPELKLSWGYR